MDELTQADPSGTSARRGADFWLIAVAISVNIAASAIKIAVGAQAPLWIDETFTGAFAAEPNLGAVFYQILHDQNAPAYYLVAHFMALHFGLSNAVLRFPALLFGVCAPFLCLLPTQSLARRTRWIWFALLSLWSPTLAFSQMARGYTLLFCFCIAATIAYIRMLDRPTIGRAALWAACGGLAIVTHYFALAFIFVQGVVYLATRREQAVRTWPAALAFVPVFAWLLFHMSCILQFVGAGHAWYDRLGGAQLALIFFMFLGGVPYAILTAALLLAVWRFAPRPGLSQPKASISGSSAATAVLATILGLALVLVIAAVRPVLTPRYLFPFAPGVLLGMALLMERARLGLFRAAPLLLVATFSYSAWTYASTPALQGRTMNFQAASDDLMEAHVKRLAFLWDNPANAVEDVSQLQKTGGFFFRRRGVDVDVRPLRLQPGEDPNLSLLKAASGKDAGILWLYDLGIHDTAALKFPARLQQIDPSWRCRNYGDERLGVVACVKAGQAG